jgi:hypothetical protein
MAKEIANKPATKKRGNPNWKKGGKSPNPAGAPKRGESWTEIIARYGEMTPSEAAEQSLELSKKLLSIGDGVTLKQAVVLRVYTSLLFEPQPGLLNAFMERAEGKVKDKVEVSGDTENPIAYRQVFQHSAALAGIAPRPVRDSGAPSADQDGGDGAALGQDLHGG